MNQNLNNVETELIRHTTESIEDILSNLKSNIKVSNNPIVINGMNKEFTERFKGRTLLGTDIGKNGIAKYLNFRNTDSRDEILLLPLRHPLGLMINEIGILGSGFFYTNVDGVLKPIIKKGVPVPLYGLLSFPKELEEKFEELHNEAIKSPSVGVANILENYEDIRNFLGEDRLMEKDILEQREIVLHDVVKESDSKKRYNVTPSQILKTIKKNSNKSSQINRSKLDMFLTNNSGHATLRTSRNIATDVELNNLAEEEIDEITEPYLISTGDGLKRILRFADKYGGLISKLLDKEIFGNENEISTYIEMIMPKMPMSTKNHVTYKNWHIGYYIIVPPKSDKIDEQNIVGRRVFIDEDNSIPTTISEGSWSYSMELEENRNIGIRQEIMNNAKEYTLECAKAILKRDKLNMSGLFRVDISFGNRGELYFSEMKRCDNNEISYLKKQKGYNNVLSEIIFQTDTIATNIRHNLKKEITNLGRTPKYIQNISELTDHLMIEELMERFKEDSEGMKQLIEYGLPHLSNPETAERFLKPMFMACQSIGDKNFMKENFREMLKYLENR